MKRIFFIHLFLGVIYFGAEAQKREANFFSTESRKFTEQVKDFFGQTARDDLKEASDKLSKDVTTGAISSVQVEKIVQMFNLLYERRTPTYPYYLNYLQTIYFFNKSGQSESVFLNWSEFLFRLTKEQNRGDNKKFATFNNFLSDLFEKNALYSDKAKTWYLKDRAYELVEENGQPALKVSLTDLIGYTREDTITISTTSGKYYPMTNMWEGKGGKSTWERAGIPEEEASVTYNSYKINFQLVNFTIDTVRLVYGQFFKEPIYGRFEDKLVPENKAENTVYPKFFSFRKDFDLRGVIADNIVYRGDFNLIGPKVFARATDTTDVMVEFYLKDLKTKALIAKGSEISVIKGKRISIDNAETILLYAKDTMIHPSLNVQYDFAKNELRLLRGESGIDRSRFYTTFHKMEFEADLINWKFNEDSITFKMLSGAGKTASVFISESNFDKATYNTARGAAFYDPLTLMRKASEDLGSRDIPLYYLAKLFDKSLTEEQTLPLVYLLIENGFVFYNPYKKIVTIREKVISYYLLANSKRVDYDILKIKAFGKDRTAFLDLKNFSLYLKDCRMIPFNDSTEVTAYPKPDSLVVVGKNRDMKFDAKILCGRMDMYGDRFEFKYDSFTIKANKLDTMRINIPDGDKKDIEGREVLRPLTSKIENIKGLIEINKPDNKSGRLPYFMYPRLRTTEPCFVYYDMLENNGGIYKRDKFFFEIKPFVQDSLLRFDPGNVFYDGKLVTAGIFPDIPQRLNIQEDFSLGFKHLTPAGGLPLYQGRGEFTGDIHLNNHGLNGKGKIVFQTTTINTDSVIFFPELALTTTKDLTMTEQKVKGKVEFPEVTSSKNNIVWQPYKDSMTITSHDTVPFKMYRGITSMNGVLNLSSKGLSGAGSLDWSEASVQSDLMKFKATIMTADTAALLIKTLDGDKVTFKTPNVKAKIDFIERMGDFKSNTADISTDFAYNQYKAFLNEFKWDIDAKILDFSAPAGSDGALFQSLHPNQDSLIFKAQRGRYNLVTSIIKCEGVKEILVADSRVIPDKGEVKIYPEARMETLKNCKLQGDTTHNWHLIENATIDIYGKNDLVGYGDLNLKVNNKDQIIKFSSIKVNKTEEKGPKRTIIKKYTVQADGNVPSEQKLLIYPNVFYYGDVRLNSEKQYLNFTGSARLKFNNPARMTDWFLIQNDVNTNQFYFYKDSVFSESMVPLYTSINLDKVSLSGLYTSILEGKQSPTDQVLIDAKGVIMHEKTTGKYLFGDSAKIKGNSLKGNMIEYNDTAGTVRAEGKIDFNFNFGGLPIKTAGYIENNLAQKKYDFHLTAGLKFLIDKTAMNLITNTLIQETMDNRDLTYDKEEHKRQFCELLDKKDFEKYMTESAVAGNMQNPPKRFLYNLVLTNLHLEFNEIDMAYRSKGDFGLVSIGGKMINKNVSGYVEFGHRGLTDFFNIYIKTPSKEWVYFGFKNNTLQIVSSLEDINGVIGAIDQKKRLVKKSDLEYYLYMLGLESDAKDFSKRMLNGGMFEDPSKEEMSGDSTLIDPELIKSTPSIDSAEFIEMPEGEVVPKPQVVPGEGGKSDEVVPENKDQQGGDGTTEQQPAQDKKSKKKKKGKGEEAPIENPVSVPQDSVGENGENMIPSAEDAVDPAAEKEKAKKAKEEEKRLKEEAKAREKAEKEAAKKAKEGQVPAESGEIKEQPASPEAPASDETMEADRKAKEEVAKKAKEEAERKAKEDAEAAKKAKAEEERKAKEEAKAREKAEKEAAKKAKEEQAPAEGGEIKEQPAAPEAPAIDESKEADAAKKAKEEADRKAKEEADAAKKAKEEANRKAKEEADAAKKAKEEADRKAKEEAEAAKKAKAEEERKAKEEADAAKKAKEEAERKAKEEEEAAKKAKAEEEKRLKEEAKAKEKAEKEAEKVKKEQEKNKTTPEVPPAEQPGEPK